jgi:putative membrane protein
MGWLVNWFLSALAVLGTAYLVPGFEIRGLVAALIAAAVIGVVNATLGTILGILTLPLNFLTLGILSLFVNALLLKVAAAFTPGFLLVGFWPAFWGSIVLTILNLLLKPFRATA